MDQHVGHAVVDQEALQTICRRYPIRALYVFGSAVRQDFTEASDIDLLVDFEPEAPVGLFMVGNLQMDLSEVFGRSVDLITVPALERSRIKDAVLRDRQVVYVH